MTEMPTPPPAGERLAKVIARSGLCSRRDAELWIKDGRIAVNGKTVKTPAFNVTERDVVKVDGEPLGARQGTRVWLYHKPAGLVVTEKDPEGRETIFEKLEEHGLPRVVTIGRLDINTEGLLLLTNDGGLKRVLELPSTGWLRKYRVRAHGTVTQPQLDRLKEGLEVDGIKYGPIEATLEREQGSNVWLLVALREGKNREVKNVLASLGLQVNRLIRISFGPFQLGDIPIGAVETVKARVLRDQLGKRLADEAGVDFESDLPGIGDESRKRANPKLRAAPPGKPAAKQRPSVAASTERFRFTDRAEKSPRDRDQERPHQHRPGRQDTAPPRKPRRSDVADEGPARRVHFDDGRPPGEFRPKLGKDAAEKRAGGPRTFGDKPRREPGDGPPRGRPAAGPRVDRGDRPQGAERRARPDRPSGSGHVPKAQGRPPRSDSDTRPPRGSGDARPKRDFGDKPRSPRPAGNGPRPHRGPAATRDSAAPSRGPRGPRPGGPGGKPRVPRKTRT
jgi:23S rRNA pseudouridine2605 synthase